MNVTLDLDLQLTERSRILLDALGKMLPPRVVAPAPDEAVQSTAQPGNGFLKVGERSEDVGGIYAGIARGLDGEPDGHLYLLDDKPAGKLKWADAAMWAANLGNGARLPTRFESALLYANLQDQLDTENWHWTSTQYSDYYAWGQGFDGGYQGSSTKSYEGRCRAVRRLVI